MSKMDGQCMCGSLTYTVDEGTEPMMAVVCHCTDCQRQSGAAFSINIALDENAFHLNGDTVGEFETTSEETQTPVQRKFCTNCGSPIISVIGSMPGVIAIKAGTMNDTSWVAPEAEVWSRSKQGWVDTNDDLGVFEKGFPVG